MSGPPDAVRIELDLPEGLSDSKQAIELIRAWVADGNLVVTLSGEAFGDRLEEWGRLLAHIGQHVANAANLNGRVSTTGSMSAIRKGFEDAIAANTAPAAGKVRGRVTH